jgi:hypothetical protein
MSAGFYPMSGRPCPLIFSILNIKEAGAPRLPAVFAKQKPIPCLHKEWADGL